MPFLRLDGRRAPERTQPRDRRPAASLRPAVEALEGRALLSTVAAAELAARMRSAHHALATETRGTAATATGPAGGVRALSNLVYETVGGRQQHLDLYLPTGHAPAGGWPVILGLPGGGWRWVDRNSLGVTLATLTADGYAVAVADYAFASSSPGSHIWPANFDDVQNAIRWIRGNAGRFGFDSTKIAVWGESAGGHLANLLGTDPSGPVGGPAPRGQFASLPANVEAVIDFYGPTDLTQLYADAPKVRPYLETFLGGTPQQFPTRYADASPVTHVSSSDPPFLIYQGLTDTANVPSQSIAFASALHAAGVPHIATYFPETPHGFRLKPYGNQGVDLLPQILQFLDDALNHAGQGIPT